MQDTVETLTVEPPGPSDSPVSAADSQLGEPPVFTRGACLGRYVILEAIGGGGMGTILSAYDPELARKVAIKVLHRRLLMSEARVRAEARLLREARAVARLAHPNVVAVYDVGEVGGCFFIAMELIEGQSLAAWLDEGGRPWRQVVEIFEKAGRGLAAAHDAGLVHRDFKPSNVMLAHDGRVLVVDFGLALNQLPEAELKSSVDGGGSSSPNSSSGIDGTPTPGTPIYMAPEQCERRRVDARADQYSFCVSLYQALFDELPSARDISDKRAKVLSPGVPSRIHQALLRGLSPDPAGRFPDLDDLLAEIGSRRWQRHQVAALFVVALAVLGLAVMVSGNRGEKLCAGGERRLGGVWDAPREAKLQQLILSTQRPYVEDVWGTVKRSLDDYSQAWQAQYTEACEATHRRGEQSPEMLDRRMACLDERLLELREVTGLLLLGEAEVLARSIDTVNSLGRLGTCRDRNVLLGLPAPLTGEARQLQLEVQAKLANARALEAAARFPQVVEVSRAALTAAEHLENRPLIGEAHYWLAMGVGRLGQFAELRQHLMQASQVALATRDDDLLARSMIRLVITGSLRGDAADAEEWAALAEAVIERLTGRADLEARRLQSLCFVALRMRQFEKSAEHCRAALDTDPEMSPPQRSIALNNLGISLVRLERVDEALEIYDESLALIKAIYGDQHPNYAGTLSNIADVYKNRGELDEAQKRLQRALAVVERSYGRDSQRILPELAGLGAVLMERGQVQQAVPYLQRAVDLEPPDPAHLAIVRFDLASALWALGEERAKSLELAGQALEAFISLGQPYEAEVATATAWLEQRR